MCTYFKDTSGLSTSHRLQNLNKKTDKRNKEARSDSMRTANSLNRYNVNTIQNKRYNTIQLYKAKDNERGGALRGRIGWRREG
jgi:hypothetical protein